ncbi:glycosyltransferase family 9 protein [Tolypothrix sp. FACHB-123]|uniref:glycosyltransferase family 9 protein n=1 Tax=Tolypothrix sp. FACHB-123 TaxID=2692868 RepID=UPI0016894C5D|nr:glycosyltransferase family 9 protein [Tolypothrix sp. FACHB-123]MBD2357077.1 glycosyltransferase family 9 protein [Tolypothrix sp. FACHB-123]
MEIFSNQPLRPHPHIAIFSSTKVGNFVVITPLLRGLKEKYPDSILDFFGSEITKDLEIHSPYIDWRFSLYTDRQDFLGTLAQAVRQRCEIAGVYDLAINCDEFSEINLVTVTAIRPTYVAGGALSQDFRLKLDASHDPVQKILSDPDWNSPAFLNRHQEILTSNYISEIFCRIAYVETDFFQLELPSKAPNFPVPDVIISVTATRPAKMWPVVYWQQVIQWCESQGLTVGLVGSSPQIQQTLYFSDRTEDYLLAETSLIDLRGKTSLTELAGTCRQARLCITVDSGLLHIAAAVGCPTVAIFGNDVDGDGASPIRLWSPRQPYVKIALTDFKCTICQEHNFHNKFCLVDNHPCMTNLLPQTVINYLQNLNQYNYS